MKNVILAEPSLLVSGAELFFLFSVLAVLAGIVFLIVFLLRKPGSRAPTPTPSIKPTVNMSPVKCPKCGAPLPPDSPEGLCPRCLMAANLAPPTEIAGETAPGGTQTVKPPPAAPLPVEEVARLFPQMEILECLGRGGMGAVYKARQPRLDRLVALKIITPEKQGEPQFAERFEREARALARLHHPNIVTVYDFGEAQGNFYLLMEFVDGLTLRQLLQPRKLSPAEALGIVPKICEALQYAHEQGIVHRDIKPENILLDKSGCVKIADFGIAKILGDGGRTNLTAEQVVGTPHYMAPEQVEHPQAVDHRADIYSLGVVFYEMLTGELPLGKFAPPSRKVEVDVRLDEVVLHALEKEPSRRYQQASQVKTDVETIAGTPSAAGSVAKTPPLFATPGSLTTSDKAILPAFLLAFFFGVFGAHRFYVGRFVTACVQLLALSSCVLWIVLCAAGAPQPLVGLILAGSIVGCLVWATIDWILIVCRAFTDGQGRRITNWLHPSPGDSKPKARPISKPPATPPGGAGPVAGASSQAAPPAIEKTLTVPTGMIVAPAVGLMIAGGWKLLSALTALLVLAGFSIPWFPAGLPGLGFLHPGSISVVAGASVVFFTVIPALLTLFGAFQMLRLRSYAWAIAAGILAILSCSLLGLAAGIWTLIVLARDDVKAAFGSNASVARTTAAPNPSWRVFGIVAACVILIGLAVLIIGYAAAMMIPSYARSQVPPFKPLSAQELQQAGIREEGGEFRKNSTRSFPLDPGGRFTIDNVKGRIEIHGWSSNLVVLNAVIHGKTGESVDAVKINVDSEPKQVLVHTDQPSSVTGPWSWGWLKYDKRNDASVDYIVQVPQDARLAGVSSVNGDVSVDGVSGDIEASTVNGSAQVKDVANDLKLSSVNGRIDAELAALGRGQSVKLDNVNGRIGATLPADADAQVSASSINGGISSDFPELVVKKESPANKELKGKLGNGGASVKATTVNGGIQFRRGAAKGKSPAAVN